MRCQVVQKALSDHPGSVRITTDEDSYNHLVAVGGTEVTATTLDALLGDRHDPFELKQLGSRDWGSAIE
jgi:hypothetical protein